MLIKISPKTFIRYEEDSETARVIKKDEVVADLDNAKAKLLTIKKSPTNAEYIDWAKANYPSLDTSVEVDFLNNEIATKEAILNEIKAL